MHVFYCKKCKKDSLTPICEHCGQPITALSSNERFKWRAIRVPLGDARSIWGALKVLALAEQVVRLPGAYYHYLQREGSAMNNKNCARNVEILYAFDDILGWFGEHGLREAYRDELTFLAISHLLKFFVHMKAGQTARASCSGSSAITWRKTSPTSAKIAICRASTATSASSTACC